jgi:rubrerythrin
MTERCISMPDAPSRVPSAEHAHCAAAFKFNESSRLGRFVAVRPSAEPPDRRPASWRGERCCYENETYMMGVGRPLHRGGQRWLTEDTESFDDPVAQHWHTMARAEFASVAAFEELAAALRSHGAPASLLAKVRSAARDEKRHAELCYGELSRMVGRSVHPGRITPPTDPTPDLKGLALSTLRDGCFEETVGALLAEELAQSMPPGTKRAALERIARDERRHAALAFRILAFCVHRDPSLASALRSALSELAAECDALPGAPDECAESDGVPSAARVRSLAADTLSDIVAPCVDALLQSEATPARRPAPPAPA